MLVALIILVTALLLTYLVVSNYYGTADMLFSLGLTGYQILIVIVTIPTVIYLLTSGKLQYIIAAVAIIIVALLFIEFEVLDGRSQSIFNR